MTSLVEAPNRTPAGERGSRRDGIVLKHLTLVKALAERIGRNLPVAVDPNDLYQAGVVGLLNAVQTYDTADTARNGAFHSYAEDRIKATIFESLRHLDWPSGCESHHPDRMDQTGDGLETRMNCRTCVQLRLKTVDAAGGFSQGRGTPDFAAGPESQPDRICERNELRQTLAEAFGRLPNRYRKVLILSYDNDMTIKQISGLFGVSESRISQIRRKALQKMSAELQSGGFVHYRPSLTGGRMGATPDMPY